MNTAADLSNQRVEQDTKLDNNLKGAIRLILYTLANNHGKPGEEAIGEINAAMSLLWGQDFVDSVQADAPPSKRFDDNTPDHVKELQEQQERYRNRDTSDARVMEPDVGVAMSLRQIYETGRCTKAEFTRMSLASVSKSDRALFCKSRADCPANVFPEGPQEVAAESVRMARFAHGINSRR